MADEVKNQSESRPDAPYTEANTGAESSYVHGGQRPLENPPRGTGEDVSGAVADDLNQMHVDSKLDAQDPQVQQGLAPKREGEEQAELERRRKEAFELADRREQARLNHAQAVNQASDAVRDRTLAVQEEIATRERDGAIPGTPAFERRQQQIRDIVNQTSDVEDARPVADRLEEIAATLHTSSPAAIETAQHRLMALAAELRDGNTRREPVQDKAVA